MGATLGRKRKIDWVKSTVPAAIRRFAPGNFAGLWAFGTNPSKKCEDAGELVPLQPAASGSGAIDQKLASLQPKAARTPVTATLRASLKSLGNSAGKSTSVILITGAGDDCGVDICTSAKELKTLYPEAKLDIFGLAVSPPAVEAYSLRGQSDGRKLYRRADGRRSRQSAARGFAGTADGRQAQSIVTATCAIPNRREHRFSDRNA